MEHLTAWCPWETGKNFKELHVNKHRLPTKHEDYALATSQLLNLIFHDKCFGRQATIKTAVSLPKDRFLLSFRLYPFGKTEYVSS